VHKSVPRAFGRTRATALGAALLAGATLPAAGLWAGIASAAPTCTTSGPTTTCTFAYTGAATAWAVPSGVTALTVTADGGAGAAASSTYTFGGGSAGLGGEYKANLTNIPSGTTLSVFPGGKATGATGGLDAGVHGGNGGTDSQGNTSGGGGGASTVAISPVSVPNVLVVAGGGGGGGAENSTAVLFRANGGAGGGSFISTGYDGKPVTSTNRGHGGTVTTPGAGGGTLGCTVAATAGVQVGGGNSNSGTCTFIGGGGGSGYFGGGGAAAFAGGGGGSGFPKVTSTVGGITVTPVTSDHATHPGNGSVTISYAVPQNTTTTLTSSSNPSFFNQSVTLTAVVSPNDGGGTVAFKDGATTISGCAAQSLSLVGGSYQATCTTSSLSIGTHPITAVYSGDTGFVTSTSSVLNQVVGAAPTSITTSAMFTSSQQIVLYGTLNSFGDTVPGETLTFSVAGTTLCTATTNSAGVASCTLTYNQALALRQNAGRYRVSFAGDANFTASSVNGQVIIQH
jgi:hypothetical protein